MVSKLFDDLGRLAFRRGGADNRTAERIEQAHHGAGHRTVHGHCNFCATFGQRVERASKFRAYVLSANGYAVKELPGPATFIQWRADHYPLGAPDPPQGVKNVTYIITFLYPLRNIGVWGGR